jgi:hypothetical protein
MVKNRSRVLGSRVQNKRFQVSKEDRRQRTKLEGEVILPVICLLSSKIFFLKPET